MAEWFSGRRSDVDDKISGTIFLCSNQRIQDDGKPTTCEVITSSLRDGRVAEQQSIRKVDPEGRSGSLTEQHLSSPLLPRELLLSNIVDSY
jgi:hypothetical protein